MSDWQTCKLRDVIDIKHGYAFKGEYFSDDETENILLTPGNFQIGGGFKSDKFKYYTGEVPSEYVLHSGDIIVTMTDLSKEADTLGYSAVVPCIIKKKLLHNQRLGRLIRKSDSVDLLFINWLLRTEEYRWHIIGSASGSTVSHTSPTRILEYEFLLPPLPEQRAIAAVLSSLDDKIDLLNRQNKTLEALAETLWRKMFVEDNQNSILTNLGSVIEIYDSKRIPLSSMEREKMKDGVLYPYYGAAEIMDYINQYIFDGEYLLLGEDGTVETEDGYPILQIATGKFWVNNHTHVLRAKKPFSNFLLYIILKNTSISHIVTGAVQPKINQENLKSLEISSAKDGIVEELSVILDNYWRKIQTNIIQIRTLSRLRDSLLPKLMSGAVTVKL